MAVKHFCLLICCYFLLVTATDSEFTPVTHKTVHSTECGQGGPLQDEQLMEDLKRVHEQLGPPGCNPPRNRSCQEILYCFPSAPSGYHKISVPNGSLVEVYCDMEGTNCGGQGGWMRVAHVNMSQSGASCPEGLEQKVLSELRLCGQNSSGCQETVFSTLGIGYSQVCGQLRGYQDGAPDAFLAYNENNNFTINEAYVDGVSITYGGPATKHIWTYANGLSLQRDEQPTTLCPCTDGSTAQVPPYVGNDYYCETGYNNNGFNHSFFPDDPLWDGHQCVGTEVPCCTNPNMPWFIKTLNETTTEDVKLRVCNDQGVADEQTLLQLISIFVY